MCVCVVAPQRGYSLVIAPSCCSFTWLLTCFCCSTLLLFVWLLHTCWSFTWFPISLAAPSHGSLFTLLLHIITTSRGYSSLVAPSHGSSFVVPFHGYSFTLLLDVPSPYSPLNIPLWLLPHITIPHPYSTPWLFSICSPRFFLRYLWPPHVSSVPPWLLPTCLFLVLTCVSKPPPSHTLNRNITLAELLQALKKLQKNKVVSLDGMKAEFILDAGELLHIPLLTTLNYFLTKPFQKPFPLRWSTRSLKGVMLLNLTTTGDNDWAYPSKVVCYDP